MIEKVKIAIIGCGRIGGRHAGHISNYANLVAVCDNVPEKAKDFGEKYDCPSFSSIEDLLAANLDIDVVAICSPNGLHARHSIQSLNAGYNVLCEKPMGINVHECGEMIKAAEKNKHEVP